MRIRGLCSFLMLLKISIVCGQGTDQAEWTISGQSGWVHLATIDHLINYYTYAGTARWPVSLEASYDRQNDYLVGTFFYQTVGLEPASFPENYYAYNHIQHTEGSMQFAYYRKLLQGNQFFSIYAGLSTLLYVAFQEERYQSLLAYDAGGYRRSYDLSKYSLAPTVLGRYHLKKHRLQLQASYALVSCNARPEDLYVNEQHPSTSYPSKWYGGAAYKNVRLAATYRYRVGHTLGVTAAYGFSYRTYAAEGDRYLRHTVMMGLYKTF